MKNYEKFMQDYKLELDIFNQFDLVEGAGKSTCPKCSADRKPENQKSECMSLDWGSAKGTCHHCDARIDLHTYKAVSGLEKPPSELISLPVKEFFKARGIGMETLLKCGVEGKVKKIYFNYFKDGNVVKVKYRTTFDKKFYSDAGGESAPYNLDAIDGLEEIIITEGEIDALSFVEAGLDNVISVPNGAKSKSFIRDYHYYFRNLKKVIIAVDGDEAGDDLAKMLTQSFKGHEIERIDFLDVKDANDYLEKHGAVQLRSLILPDEIAETKNKLTFDFEAYGEMNRAGKVIYDIPDMVLTESIATNYVMMADYGFFFPIIGNKITFGSPINYENFISLIRDAGFKSTNEIKRVINSSSITKITAIDILLHQLQNTKWDGVDRITAVVDAFHFKNEGHGGQELFRKWFVNALAFTLRLIEPSLKDKKVWNKLVPMIISLERNWYKTTALRVLGMQGFLAEFFKESGENIQIDLFTEWEGNLPDDPRELAIASTQSFIISIDDIDNMLIDQKVKSKLRSLISKETVTSRMLYTSKNETKPKTCVYIASSNRTDLLRDRQETRYLPLMLDKPIDKDFFFKLDAFQFWAQVFGMVKEGSQEDLNFSKKELTSIIDINEAFIYTSGLEDFVVDNFEFSIAGSLTWDEVNAIMLETGIRFSGSELRNALTRIADEKGAKVKSRVRIDGKMQTHWRFKFVGKHNSAAPSTYFAAQNQSDPAQNEADLPF